MNAPLLSPGEKFGSYAIVRLLGKGGMGEVYEAEQRAPRRNVALKVLLPNLAGHPVLTQRFEGEIQAMASVEHEHVVPIYAQGEVDGTCFFTMRLIDGTSLDKLVGRRDFRREDLLTVLGGAAAGLDACHAKDVVHRDVKPPNIMWRVRRSRARQPERRLSRASPAPAGRGRARGRSS